MNIIKNRYLYFLISLLVIIPGLVFMGLLWAQTGYPLRLGLDFRGGALLEVKFAGTRPDIAVVTGIYNNESTPEQPLANPVIQSLGVDSYAIRSNRMDEPTKLAVVQQLAAAAGAEVTVENFTTMTAAIGSEVTRAAGIAIAMAAAAILLFIWFAFRGVEHSGRFGTAAVLAMLHDILVVLGVEAFFGYVFGWEADALFLTALLTVIGFSVHDTIVVFDRIRENAAIYRKVDFAAMVNHSVVQTLDRSINTQMTVLFTLFALALFGGETTRHFVIILLIGILSGTYSSIFNASPILVVWQNREWTNWFRSKAPAVPAQGTNL